MEFNEVRQKMTKAIEMLQDELVALRVGQANPSLIEKVMVEAYETKMPLVELATITTAGPNQLVVAPFDQSVIKNIQHALSIDRNLGLSARIDENVVRVNIPPLTAERRQEFIKILHQKIEAARVMIRQIRHEKMIEIKKAFENKEVDEDEKFRQEEELQKITDEFNEKISQIGGKKEAELLSI